MLAKAPKLLFCLLIALIGVAVMAGCAPAPAAPQSSASQPATPSSAASGAKWSERLFVKAYISLPKDIDPHGVGWDNSYEPVQHTLYENLVEYSPKTFKLEPVLAESWEIGSDGKTFTFKLRKNVKFHDGSNFTAEAVKLSLERIIALGFGRAKLLRNLDKIDIVDDYTVRLTLKEVDAVFLSKVPTFFIASGQAMKAHPKDDWFLKNEAGTGAYMLEFFEPGADSARFRPFADYWRGWAPPPGGTHLGRIEIRVVPETPTQRLLLESGEAHFMQRYPVAYNFEVKNNPMLQLASARAFRVSYLPLNVANGPLKDIRLRKMLQYAFPYDALVKDYYQGLAVPAAGPLHPDYLPDPTLKPMTQDLAKAKELLEQAGYKPGQLKLTYLYPTGGEEQKQPGILLQDALRKIGVDLQVDTIPWANIVERVAAGPGKAPDIMTLINAPTIADPGVGMLEQFFHSVNKGGPYNWGWYVNPELDRLLDEAQKTVDEQKRLDMYRQVQRMALDDAVGVWLCFPDRWNLTNKDVGGYVYNPIGAEWQSWYDMYWKN